MLKEKYQQIIPVLKKEWSVANYHALPKIEKAVINVGVGKRREDDKFIKGVEDSLRVITGQQPIKTLARKSIASFKLREGMPIGFKITLRGQRMYDFLDKLITVVLPRTRDFRGLKESAVDKTGNLNIGIVDQAVFPEIDPEETPISHGLEVAIKTSAKSREEGMALFKALGFPFRK